MWNTEHKEAFQQMKDMMAKETLLTYPDFPQPFIVHTDASSKQIGSVICQQGKPLGFFSKKLTEVQQRYPVTEQELLAIVETLKYFCYMLLGHRIIILTDHKNLIHLNLHHSSNRVLRQRLLIEEYGAELEYVKGENNVVADTLSRLPTEEIFAFSPSNDDAFPLDLMTIAAMQQKDKELQLALAKDTSQTKYKKIMTDQQELTVCTETEAIYVPAELRAPILNWYQMTVCSIPVCVACRQPLKRIFTGPVSTKP
jgi:hypothetical protein